jgi:hypothetical protein
MANALGPYYVIIRYHSADAPHTMTIPTRNWNTSGDFDTWAFTTIPATTMIPALVTLMLPFFNSDTQFDNATIFQQLLPTDDPQPVEDIQFSSMVGTNVSASWAQAVEVIIVARTQGFGIAKLDLLDAVSDNDFSPVTTLSGRYAALHAEWIDDNNGWSGRDNTKPSTFLKATINLNQKLRKEYRLD